MKWLNRNQIDQETILNGATISPDTTTTKVTMLNSVKCLRTGGETGTDSLVDTSGLGNIPTELDGDINLLAKVCLFL